MAQVTIQLIEGLERGHVYADLATPVTIGREEENAIRLNDERVSRFHAKIQQDGGRVILTDLDSTNGTRVNGHPVQMRILQIGDQLSIGRCLLIFGSRTEIAERAARFARDGRTSADSGGFTIPNSRDGDDRDSADSEGELDGDYHSDMIGSPAELFPAGPPQAPSGLRPVQKAEISDFLAYVHEQLRIVLETATEQTDEGTVTQTMLIDWVAWQRLLRVEMDLAVYIRQIADPDA